MLALLIALPLWAQIVAVSTPHTNPMDYENYLLHNPNQISFVQYHHKIQEQASQELFTNLKMGQFYFLDGQLDLAQKEFQEITDKAHSSDWGEKERQVVHFAFLRKAQLTSNSRTSLNFLRQAMNFDSEQRVDDQIFPPPLVQQYKNLLRERKSKVFAMPPKTAKFDQVLINGKTQLGLKSFLKIPKQVVRITFLSNIYKPQSLVTDTHKLKDLKINLKPLVSGHCENPDWDKTLFKNHKIKPIWSGCKNGKILALPSLTDQQEAIPTTSPSKLKFLQSKWFWAGVSVLATGALLHHQQQQSRANPSPQDHSSQVMVLSNKQ